uniref:Uncharacterized protein n=1 Tax=Chromera velia CCMP2878 TaxID=1169474 RepID=A0A0G4GBS0_9ALVE|eukprot:Cvel_21174.t1-p1 / transcript=Cvel_21174.t1 / gene=Cvel_21174 / organism=Chromera_velia_CCMP2878 / gene_product=hypothetical protein / transcript_product=hypothetical protein / location=Cvel_scaffold1965:11273-12592(-) / protein_length=440 / sequence_SO=supercontig / SO=protein_coding / is_pseudo=false
MTASPSPEIPSAVSTAAATPPYPLTAFDPSQTVSRNFSRAFCTGGSQSFESKELQYVYKKFPTGNDPEIRMCRFENICWIGGKLKFYADPKQFTDSATKTFLTSAMMKPGYRAVLWQPDIVQSPLPPDVPFDNSSQVRVLLETDPGGNNMYHMFWNELMTTLMVMEVFGLSDRLNSTTVGYLQPACGLPKAYGRSIRRGDKSLDAYGEPWSSSCLKWRDYWWPLMTGHSPEWMVGALTGDKPAPDVCFHQAIMGHGWALSLKTMKLTLGAHFRRWRPVLLSRILHKDPEALKMVDLPSKRREEGRQPRLLVGVLGKGNNNPKTIWPSICGDAKKLGPELGLEVVCFDPMKLSVAEAVTASLQADIFLSFHGSLTYWGLFMNEGGVIVSAGKMKDPSVHGVVYKEVGNLFTMTHVTPLFMPIAEKGKLKEWLSLALTYLRK